MTTRIELGGLFVPAVGCSKFLKKQLLINIVV